MRFLLLNQAFYPDVVSTAQHLSDLALGLVERGHEVTVVTSRRAYDDPETRFPKHEVWRGIKIVRVGSSGFGKGARWRRAVDFASFLAACSARLAMLPRQDVVVALTSPPLISFLGASLTRARGGRFFHWVMDLNPDEAIAAGWLRQDSLAARGLERVSRFSLGRAARIIALDRFMRDRVAAKGIPVEQISVIAPWSQDELVKFDPAGRESFRRAHALDGKFVVMHSGNHSPCHPLDTFLAAAERLKSDDSLAFCFVGGGSEFGRVKRWASQVGHRNLLCLPYQPLSQLSASLSAADLHLAVMGEPFVGLVHPCKIYNILSVGAPVLYLGPQPSHITDILQASLPNYPSATAPHGDPEAIVHAIQQFRARAWDPRPTLPASACRPFSRQTLLPKLIAELESSQ